MHYEDVETFLQIYRAGSVSRAAKKMYLSQSTLSQRIQRLETDLNGVLFTRRAGVRQLFLTPKGQQFLPQAEKLVEAWTNAMRAANETHSWQLSIGSIASLYDTIVTDLMKSLFEQFENPQLSCVVGRSLDLYDLIENNKLDYAFVGYEVRSSLAEYRQIFSEKHFLICSKGMIPQDELSSEKLVNVSTLGGKKELLYLWDTRFFNWHNSIFPDERAVSYIKCDSISMYKTLAASSEFWSVCPASILHYLKHSGIAIDVFDISEPPEERQIYLVYPKNADRYTEIHTVFTESLFNLLSNISGGLQISANGRPNLDKDCQTKTE